MISDLPVALSGAQRETLDAYVAELERINRRVNLVARPASRADLERHVRHCLALATRPFYDGATVVDWGTGGGLPAVPLAVAFPGVQFVGVDTVGKKSEALRLFARRLDLDNLTAWNGRAEAYDGPAPDVSVSRATAPLATLWGWHVRARSAPPASGEPSAESGSAWPRGLVCLKGGDLSAETADLARDSPGTVTEVGPLADVLGPDWADKAVVTVTDGPR